MRPSYSDLDPTCAHVDHDPPPAFVPLAVRPHRITPTEFVIGSVLGASVATGIVLWLLGAA